MLSYTRYFLCLCLLYFTLSVGVSFLISGLYFGDEPYIIFGSVIIALIIFVILIFYKKYKCTNQDEIVPIDNPIIIVINEKENNPTNIINTENPPK